MTYTLANKVTVPWEKSYTQMCKYIFILAQAHWSTPMQPRKRMKEALGTISYVAPEAGGEVVTSDSSWRWQVVSFTPQQPGGFTVHQCPNRQKAIHSLIVRYSGDITNNQLLLVDRRVLLRSLKKHASCQTHRLHFGQL